MPRTRKQVLITTSVAVLLTIAVLTAGVIAAVSVLS